MSIFDINKWKYQFFKLSPDNFEHYALEIFRYQAAKNVTYRKYIELLKINPTEVNRLRKIPFLPIELFKSNKIVSGDFPTSQIFESSGTTNSIPSRHYVADLEIYQTSFIQCFEHFFDAPDQQCIVALLPSYLERKNSSLVYMVNELINRSNNTNSGFYLQNYNKLIIRLKELKNSETPVILFGVSFALLYLAENHPCDLSGIIIIETGGMKGKRKEISRYELHSRLKKAFNIDKVCSEYGMTELLSQAYSTGNQLFESPTWMKILIRDLLDPFKYVNEGQSGAINIIDLANIHSCCFIATEDLGRQTNEFQFEVLGRTDSSEVRGCNLMME